MAFPNTAPPPSSFDDLASEYGDETRWMRVRRRIIEEPLIPIGCALTCWALYEASRSIRMGDKHRTNMMFRRRIYAQGFTLLAMVGGSVYWQKDRAKRSQYNELLEDKKRKERHEAWLRELEVREQDEQDFKQLQEKLIQQRVEEKKKEMGKVQSVLEDNEARWRERFRQSVYSSTWR
ncbi:hypothetical protein K470DRAFT_274564 [Piedraia hortae CBS 480.64]|uniref:HIG1 domain-containing protein n=1 Tax=Piedraia hortae CBS 480.64 TaxID=1314780 RepID=A0A6A7C7V4_9PEZI|nr:hypothetical protein K470DRAFT_274564 [Piedraia hortae CBS 480.64]